MIWTLTGDLPDNNIDNFLLCPPKAIQTPNAILILRKSLTASITNKSVDKRWFIIFGYYSFIYPYLTYCNQIWGTAFPTHQTKWIVIQKKAVRIIAGAKYRAPTDALFSDLGILKFVDVNIYLTMLFVFRVHNNMVPDQFQMMFNYNRDIHPYVTRQSNHIHIPMAKTNLGKKCIKYHGSVIWNKVIKLNIPTDTSEAVFKRSVKKEIIRGVWLFISE